MTDERKRALLERAIADKELLASVPPIVAFAFGVLPLKLEGTVLTLASMHGACPEAIRALRAVLDREIVAAPFEERLLQTMIQKAYPDEQDHDHPRNRAGPSVALPHRSRLARGSPVNAGLRERPG